MIKLDTIDELKTVLDTSTSGDRPLLPGVVYCAVDSHGNELFKHASGKRGLGQDDPMTLDAVFWLASFTKVLTGIACMQLVEQGRIDLDNASGVEKVLPELASIQVLDNDGIGRLELRPQQTKITLRMLLNHTGQ